MAYNVRLADVENPTMQVKYAATCLFQQHFLLVAVPQGAAQPCSNRNLPLREAHRLVSGLLLRRGGQMQNACFRHALSPAAQPSQLLYVG